MQSIDEFTPSTTEPVFGSGLISQSKSQPATKNDISDDEKIVPTVESVINGQNDLVSPNGNATNARKETIATDMDSGDLAAVHGNSQNEQLSGEIANEVKPAEEPISTSKSMTSEQPVEDKPGEQPILTSESMITEDKAAEEPISTSESITEDKAAEEPISTSESMITEDKAAEEPFSTSESMITEGKAAEEPFSTSESMITEDKAAEEPISTSDSQTTEQIVSASESMVTKQRTEDKPAEESISMATKQLTQAKSAEEPISTEQLSQSEAPASVDRPEPLLAKPAYTTNEDLPLTDIDKAQPFVSVEVMTTNIKINDNVSDLSTTIKWEEMQHKSKVKIEIWNCFGLLKFCFKLVFSSCN